ncbi:MAG: hypothetical protein OXT72_13185, partial [Gammaproteobacteria bacterium]|nr:hypothetical protein [Gammaproteobacteria bacterium]MDE0247175.1 hypothetical protein [Gammaproteobacteria bacterium]
MVLEQIFHRALVWAMFAMAIVTFAVLLRLKAPYGRYYAGHGWGPALPNRVGWVLMELPAAIAFAVIYFIGSSASEPVPLIFFGIWQCHYLNRALVYPLRTRTAGKRVPLAVVASGIGFNVVNAYVNARFVSEFGAYGVGWLADPRFLGGLAILVAGLALNIHSDNILLGLREPGESGYAIPRGGGFRYVSCPSYLIWIDLSNCALLVRRSSL